MLMQQTCIFLLQQDTSPLPQVNLTTQPAGGVVNSTSSLTTTTDSLTTPVLSLTTPNIFSSLPPIFSSLVGGDFPFNQPSAPNTAGGGAVGGAMGGSGGDTSSAALVAFPVSIQPSATSGSGTGNLILQAQNMGQPFLLTPTYDSRQNPLFTSQSYSTPPTSSLPAGLSPSIGGMNLEQLKLQYERTQQMIQQQLLYTQMQMMQQQQDKDGGVTASSTVASPSMRGMEAAGVIGSSRVGRTGDGTQYINGSDVMIGSHSQSQLHGMGVRSRSSGEEGDAVPPDKKARLDTSTGQ